MGEDVAGTGVYLGLGSNRGNRPAELRAGLEELSQRGLAIGRVSSLYLTEPRLEGATDSRHPWYVNCVASVERPPEPRRLLEICLDAERARGRTRRAEQETSRSRKPRPRTLDVDLLLYGDRIIDSRELTVPHPRLHRRRFVLVPLCELDPDVVHPVTGLTMKTLLERLPEGNGVWLMAPPPRIEGIPASRGR